MKPFVSGKSLLAFFPLLLFACCLCACNSDQPKKQKTRTPIVCKDTSKHDFALDTVKGYQLKPEVNLNLLLNIESFNTKEEFDKYFMRPPIPADSTPPSLNFKDNWLVAIITDNRTPDVHDLNRWVDVDVQTIIGNVFTKNCQLTIPFMVVRNPFDPFHTPERKFYLFRVPRSAPFNGIYVMNQGGGLSRSLDVPAAEE
ncbi:hypothetical protein L3C95_34140 [Chitinophaga filiformis]|uniref:hypothetical protein n=1 Tax=Chitinophaga filiformis TaxID=104663 RepID=UPI001F24836F|nr:hypothetical protein [Chitinophaga filiformis]MCF6407978.1 hypothetical protein [Chitinophaga filiformis]